MNQSRILIAEDDTALSEALADTLQMAGYEIVTAVDGDDALRKLDKTSFDLVVSDIHMPHVDGHNLLKQIKISQPELPVMLMTAYGSIQQAVDAMRDGAVDYMVKPFEAEVLVNMVGRYVAQPRTTDEKMVADDPVSKNLLSMARRVAESDATVMITGESGSGKEVLARYIHLNSPRAAQPFIAINCAAIPENMLEATLFGYEKGAYTGAYKACPGKFEMAQGGTLLLDEISEMDLGLQAKLLRVLQEREVERLGGNKLIALDVRVLATSNRDMRQAVQQGRFREDLFYRLNVFPLHISPLRERRGDIVALTEQLLQKYTVSSGKAIPGLSSEAALKLQGHDWPGNVRELENVIQRCLIMQQGGAITEQDVIFEASGKMLATVSTAMPSAQMPTSNEDAPQGDRLNHDLKQHEWEIIIKTIKAEGGSRKATAARLGISQRTLRYKLARMRDAGLDIPGGGAGLEAF